MNFKNYPKEQLQEFAARSTDARRSPALKQAWANAHNLRKENQQGISKVQLAQRHGITVRAVYRIINGR